MNPSNHLSQIVALEELLMKAVRDIQQLKQDIKDGVSSPSSIHVPSGFTAEEERLWFKGKTRVLTDAGRAYIVELCNNGGDNKTLQTRMGMSAVSAKKYFDIWEFKNSSKAKN